MSDHFDPYYTWLGIPPEEQPPDYYRLLGIRRFENNADVIANALDQRMVHIRANQSGPHAGHSQEILNELSKAGGCLLTTEKKGQYDRELRQKDAPKLSKSSSDQIIMRPSAPRKSAAPAPAPQPAAPAAAAPQPAPPVAAAPAPAKAVPPVAAPALRTATPLASAPAQAMPAPARPIPVAAQPLPAQAQPAMPLVIASGSPNAPVVVTKPSNFTPPADAAPRPLWQPLLLLAVGGAVLLVLGGLALVGTFVGARMLAKEDPNAPPKVKASTKSTETRPAKPKPSPPPVVVNPRPSPPPPITVVPQPGLPVIPPTVAAVQPGLNGLGLRINGTDHVELENTARIASWNQTGTAEVWARWERGSGELRLMGTLVNNSSSRTSNLSDGWALAIINSGGSSQLSHIFVPEASERKGTTKVGASFPTDDRWHHIAYAHDQSGLNIFIDGKMAGHTIAWPPRRVADDKEFTLGSPPSSKVSTLAGEISALRLSSNKRYTKDFDPPVTFEQDPNTLVLLDLSKDTGAIVSDLTGQRHQGKIRGARWVALSSKPGPVVAASGRLDKPTDLLATFDPSKDVPRGSFTKDADGWVSSGRGGFEAMVFPVELPEEYIVETVVTLLGNSSGMIQGLTGAGRQFEVTVDGFATERGGMRTALETIDGRRPHDISPEPYPCELPGSLLTRDKPSTLRYFVYKDKVVVECDGKTSLTWNGGVNRLGLHPIFDVRNPKVLFWGAWSTPIRLSKFEVRPMQSGSSPPPTTIAGVGDPPMPLPPNKEPFGPGTTTKPVGPGTTTSTSGKLALPATKDLETARTSVKDAFKAEFSKAVKPGEKVALADAFLAEAKTGKALDRYVLFEEARNLKLEAGDLDGAFLVVNKVIAQFDVDPWKEKQSALQKGLEKSDSMLERKRLLEIAMHTAESALAAAKFDHAADAAGVALNAATRMGDNRLKAAATALKDGAEKAKGQYDKALGASELIKTEPGNADANATWGKFLCLMQRNWKQGLPLLAKGSDEPLKLAAESEGATPPDPEKTAKAWDDASQAYSGRERDSLLIRAREQYQKAATSGGEIAKRRVQKRIDEISALLPKDLEPAGKLAPKIAGATPGMIGRVSISGRDAGLLLKYEPGAQLTHDKLVEKLGVSGTNFTVDVRGYLHVPEPISVEVRNSTGGKFGVFPELTIDGKRLQELGDNRGLAESYFISLPKGDHLLIWTLRGSNLGSCELDFTNVETSEQLYVYFNQAIGRVAASTPTRGEMTFSK